MKRFMMVYKTNDNMTFAMFYDDYSEAKQACMDVECGLGWYWELYMRVAIDDHNGEVLLDENGYPKTEGPMTEYRLMEA